MAMSCARDVEKQNEQSLNWKYHNSMSNPRLELSCTILKTAVGITPCESRATLGHGDFLNYDYTNVLVLKRQEFHDMNISSMIYRSADVLDIHEFHGGYSTILFPVKPRFNTVYILNQDLNGRFVLITGTTRRQIPPDSLASTLNLIVRYTYRNNFKHRLPVLITLETEKRS
jgi:hypothetical protein